MQERCWDNAVDEHQVLRVFHRCYLVKYGERTHIFALGRFSSRKNTKGITHVCYPKRSPMRLEAALQAASAKSNLTLVIWGCKCVLSMCLLNLYALLLSLAVNHAEFSVICATVDHDLDTSDVCSPVPCAFFPVAAFVQGMVAKRPLMHSRGCEQTPGDSWDRRIACAASNTLPPRRGMRTGEFLVGTIAYRCYS